jgi:glycosyltransferase involved in cell wall biosynthesis
MYPSPACVAFDLSPTLGVRTGLALATIETFEALGALEDGPELVPYAFGASVLTLRHQVPPGTRRIPIPTRALLAGWSRSDHPRFDRFLRPARAVHATRFVAPPSRLPTLVTVHDCTFARLPDTVPPHVRTFEPIIRRAVARGAWVHCTTQEVAGEVDDLFGPGLREAGRIAVVPFGIPRIGPPGPLPSDLTARLGSAPYVLALGALVPRKNLPRLVRAFGRLGTDRPDLRLVLAGPDGSGRGAIDAAVAALESTLRERVVFPGPVDEGVRRTLLEGAAVVAYPSLYEGFGFPVLEAMSLGVPVVAARAGAIPEVAGDAAALVDPLDEDALAGEMGRILDDERHRDDLVTRGRARAARFTWAETARGLRDVYRALVGGGASASA